jgi:hypothetical protein
MRSRADQVRTPTVISDLPGNQEVFRTFQVGLQDISTWSPPACIRFSKSLACEGKKAWPSGRPSLSKQIPCSSFGREQCDAHGARNVEP